MPTWGEILKELIDFQNKEKKPPFDFVRRKYLSELNKYSKRNTIIYAVNWTQAKNIPSELISITDEDVQGFMEVVSGLTDDNLDIIIHSPGGSAEATEALVIYLRSKFKHIRAIIPYGAMSAATMLACAANEIIMGKHSFIGPIDPQVIVHTRLGLQAIPAQAIIEQFNIAREECIKDPKNLGVWLPIIEQYGPALLVQCEHANELSKTLVTEWLEKYMFANEDDAQEKAKTIGNKLSAHSFFKSHARHIGREQVIELKLKITNLEDDQKLQDLVLSVFHATTHTFDATPAVKIIENHLGKAFIKQSQQLMIQVPPRQEPVLPKKK
ncbi:MAG: serine protease [candidate division WOR-3 bacterium]